MQNPDTGSIRASFRPAGNWGWMPIISLICSCGLLLIAVVNTAMRQGYTTLEGLFWIGLVVIVFPVGLRLTSSETTRRERIALIAMFGLALYLVKVMQSPYGFTFADEFVHGYNAAQIIQNKALFSANPIIATTPFYPGLEIVTSSLASLSGLSIYTSGLILIGLARLILMVSLYLFYEQVGGSARIAGIAAMLYASNSNFLFWSAQFSYESLALPLALFALYIIAKRDAFTNSSGYKGLSMIALLGISGVVITHHLSSYFLAIFLAIWAGVAVYNPLKLLDRLKRKTALRRNPQSPQISTNEVNPDTPGPVNPRRMGPGWLAIFAVLLSGGWLILVANNTIAYLSPVLRDALHSIVNIIHGSQTPRVLFQSSSGSTASSLEQIVGIGAVIIMAAGVPGGLREFWRRYQTRGLVLILVLMGLAYFVNLGLRLSPQAWETANRASEFLFIGLAFLLAIGVEGLWKVKKAPWIGSAVFTACACIVFMGGIIAGWSPQLRFQQPSQVKAGNSIIEPQGISVARWFLSTLGQGNQVGSDPSNARFLLTYGKQFAYEGSHPDVQDILTTPDFPDWQKQILQAFSIRYLVIDRRKVSQNSMTGYFFDQNGGEGLPSNPQWIDASVFRKFDRIPATNRILDSGNIVVYGFK